MICSFKLLSRVDKVKNVIKHQYIKAHCVNIKKEDNTLKYIYNNPKQKYQ